MVIVTSIHTDKIADSALQKLLRKNNYLGPFYIPYRLSAFQTSANSASSHIVAYDV